MNYRYISRHPLSALRDKCVQIQRRIFEPERLESMVSPEESVPVVVPEIPRQEPLQIDWASMSTEEQRTFFMENGFLGLSQVLSPQQLEALHGDIDKTGVTGLTE